MLAPISHAGSPEAIARWQVEAYMGCADVYTAPGQVGRGGWTWYTGTAGWPYRAAVEWILGLRVIGTECRLRPCIPRDWPGFSLELRWHSARYRFTVENPAKVCSGLRAVTLDGAPLDPAAPIALCDDGNSHAVRLVLG